MGSMRAMSRIGLIECYAGLEAGDALITEIQEADFGAIEAQRHQERRLQVHEAEGRRQNADHFT